MKRVKIGVLSTLNEERPVSPNPGDDIVRDGQRYLLGEVLGSENIEWIILNRNHPEQWFTPPWPWAVGKKSKKVWPMWWIHPISKGCRMAECDYLINASGPLIYGQRFSWSRLEPWAVMMNRIFKLHHQPVFLNLALGSQLPPGKEQYCANFKGHLINSFIRMITQQSAITTCRDPIIKEITDRNGIDAPLWPCPSLFARNYHNLDQQEGNYVAFNFYPTGTRAVTAKEARSDWMEVVKEVYDSLQSDGHHIRLIFHESKERELAESFFDLDHNDWVQPKSIPEFLKAYGGAKFAFTSRVHGSYAAASMGVPALCIGSDTRLSMVDMIGYPTIHYQTASVDEIMTELDRLEVHRDEIQMRTQTLIETTQSNYLELLQKELLQQPNQDTE